MDLLRDLHGGVAELEEIGELRPEVVEELVVVHIIAPVHVLHEQLLRGLLQLHGLRLHREG